MGEVMSSILLHVGFFFLLIHFVKKDVVGITRHVATTISAFSFTTLLLDRILTHIVNHLKVVTSEKIGGSGVISTLGTWYGGVVMGVLLPFNEAAILCRDFNSAPSQKQNIIVFAANNSRCCKCHVALAIIF